MAYCAPVLWFTVFVEPHAAGLFAGTAGVETWDDAGVIFKAFSQ